MIRALFSFLIIQFSLFQSDGFKDTSRFSYKGKIRSVLIRQYDNKNTVDDPKVGKLSEYSRILYFNTLGDIDSIHYLNSDGLGLISSFERNKNGITIERLIPPKNRGRIQKTITHNYVSQNMFELISIDARGVECENGKSIFKDQKLVEQTYKSYGVKPFKTIFEYNDNDQLILLKKTSQETHIHKFIFRYIDMDKFGNWTKRLKLYEDENGQISTSNFEIAEYQYYK